MGHYTGPKARINRRLGGVIFEDAGAMKAFERRPDAPPGMHVRRAKQSAYALALTEKQKIKYYYGLGERQLRRFLDEARRLGLNKGEELLKFCERRLDNAVRRAGFTLTRPQARQGIAHGHILVNGRKATSPSMVLKIGDLVQVRTRPALHRLYREAIEKGGSQPADWLQVNRDHLSFRVLRLPDKQDVTLPVNVSLVIELLSR